MKLFPRRSTCIAAPLFAFGCVFAAGEARAQLTATPKALDLGKRAQNQTAPGEVKLVNGGSDTVEILNVGADCSCTAATPDKTSLKPGESTSLKITFETRSYQGEIHRQLQVQTSKGDLSIEVKAVVSAYENWSISPYPVVLPPGVKGTEAATTLEFTYSGAGTGDIKSFTSTPAWLSAKLVKHEGNVSTYSVTRQANVPAGNHTVKLTVETSDPANPHLDINVFASVLSTVHVKPNPLVMPQSKVGQPVTLKATLTGWVQPVEPRFEISSGSVKILERKGEEISILIETVPPVTGSFTQLFRAYAGDSVELEVPLVLRVEP